MKQNLLVAFIVTTVVLAVSLLTSIFVIVFLYNSLFSIVTPDTSYANAKKAAAKECKKSKLEASESCENLQLNDVVDVGGDIAASAYLFKGPTLSEGTIITYNIWVKYNGNIDSTSTESSKKIN